MQRGISIGGSNTGINQTGDGNTAVQGSGNTVTSTYSAETMVPAEGIDVAALVRELRELLVAHAGESSAKVSTRFDEIETELAKPIPDRAEVGDALDQALRYTKKAGDLMTAADRVVPRLRGLASWLGDAGTRLLEHFNVPATPSDGPGLIEGPSSGIEGI
ncbi:hypothetical protein [Azospirillum argentinense]|uniref:hypothetical protein n=1 Tax=Azospirillum argentinense TaxID=2970906 RepID=UPI0032E02574